MNSANNVAKWKTGFIRHKKGIGPIFISEFADLFAAAHMYATRTYFLICICRKKKLLVWLSHAFDVNNRDDSDNESDNECGEDEEITHFVGSKNIGAAHEKNNQDNLEQAYIALWKDKIVQVYIRLLFGWITRQLLWI